MSKYSHNESKRKAWVVDVNMGYGHSRAAHALKDLSGGEIISANAYKGIPASDRKLWRQSRELYETISRMRPIPVVGQFMFEALDRWQQIEKFYPRRDLSRANIQVKSMYRLMAKGWGKHLIEKLAENPVPLVTTFFATAFFADYFDYPGEIYAVTTDADISRAWAPVDPKRSRIKYFASNGRVRERLMLYGVNPKNIFLTGFPLPKSLIGGPTAKVLKDLLAERLCNLDPKGIFHDRYSKTLKSELGRDRCAISKTFHPLTLTYSVGGAGAQKKLAVEIMKSLRAKIRQKKIRLILHAGYRKSVVNYFRSAAKDLGLNRSLGKYLLIPEYASREEYFIGFDKTLETTDILWTKPSELSFYTGLGIALIMAPPIGSQEEFNRIWQQYVGGGVAQNDPRYTNEWLFDWIDSGGVARMAWNGYLEAPTHGTYRIEDIVLGRPQVLHPLPLIV